MNGGGYAYEGFTEEQALIADAAAATFSSEGDEHERSIAAGWFGVGIPEQLGGCGGDFAELAPVLEAAGAAATPSLVPWTAGVLGQLLARSPEPPADLLKPLTSGGAAVSIPALECDRMTQTLGLAGSTDRLSGSVLALGPHSASLALPLIIDAQSCVVVVPPDHADVRARALEAMDITRPWSRYVLDGISVRETRIVPVPQLFRTWPLLTGVVFSLDAVGAARTALERTVSYARTREQFGRPIGSFQAYKHRCADAYMGLKLAQSLSYRAARSRGEPDGEFLALAAADGARAAASICATAIQLHGAIGFSWDSGLHRYLRRATANEILTGARHRPARLLSSAIADVECCAATSADAVSAAR